MDGANTNALEWALALLHTPAERYTLRQKPLPQTSLRYGRNRCPKRRRAV